MEGTGLVVVALALAFGPDDVVAVVFVVVRSCSEDEVRHAVSRESVDIKGCDITEDVAGAALAAAAKAALWA